MQENMDTKNTAPDTESQEVQEMNLQRSSHSDPPFAAPNLPVPVRQSYVSRGFGTEAIAKVVQFATEFLKKCVKPLATDRNRELGEAAARTAAKGFGDSFAGVACALSDLKETIGKKSPRSAAMLDQAGEKAKTLGQKLKNAPAEVGPKLKGLKESEKFEAAKETIDKTAAITALVLSVGAEGAEKGLKKVAHDTEVLIGGLKDKTVTKIDEHRAEKTVDEPSDTPNDTAEETRSVSETSSGIAKTALDKAGEKLQSLNQFAGTGISSEHEQSGFSKKIDEQLNKFGTVVSKKSAELTKGPLGKAGEKILSIPRQVGARVTEKLKTEELQKKLSENIKNFDADVTKKAAEEKIKKYAGAFSDKAKTLADSARQKTEDIYKSEAASGTKTAAELSEKIADLKDKVVESARDLKEQAQGKIDAIRSPRKAEPINIKPSTTANYVAASRKSGAKTKFSASAAKFRATNPRARKILSLYGPTPLTKKPPYAKSQRQAAKSTYAARVAANWGKTQNKTD